MHEPLKNRLQPFIPILPAIGTPAYKLAKFLVPIFFDLTQNEFTAQDSFTFANEILTQDSGSIYGSLDVDSYLPTLIRLKYLQKETFAEFD